jgi:hypothetical protein
MDRIYGTNVESYAMGCLDNDRGPEVTENAETSLLCG